MKISNKILIGCIIVLVVLLVALFGVKEWARESSWTAVYLRTGDLYFGKMVRFPHFGLKNVYMLQVNQSNSETPISVQQFKKVFWGPEDWIQINRDEVVWTTKLDSKGQLAEILKANPDLNPTSVSQVPQSYSLPQAGTSTQR